MIAVAGIALLLKVGVLAQLGHHPLLQPLGELDTAIYVDLARRTGAEGPLGVAESFFVAPLYVYFLAAIFSLGGSLETVRLAQIALGSTAVALIFITARTWFGATAGWLAAGLAVLVGLFTFYEILILPAALDPFLVALTLACVSRAACRTNAWAFAAAGLASGLLVLNRPNAMVYAATLALWPLWLWWGRRAEATPVLDIARRSLLLPAALLLVLFANGARNAAASGEWVLVSSHGGLNFYIGNGPEADGTYVRVPGITPSIAGQARDAARLAEAAEGRRLTAGEVSQHFIRRALAWMHENPAAAIRLWARKCALLFNHVNVPLNFSYAYYADESALLRSLAVGPWFLMPLGAVGLLLRGARRRDEGYWAWAAFVPLYGLSVIAFFVSSRYRVPLLIPLCVAAGGALAWGVEQVQRRRWRVMAAPVACVVVLAVLALWPLNLDEGRGFEQVRQAVWLVEQGRVDEAEAYVSRVGPGHSNPGVDSTPRDGAAPRSPPCQRPAEPRRSLRTGRPETGGPSRGG